MSDGSAGATVCGFSDLAAGLGGLAWDLGDGGGLLLSDNEVEVAEAAISEEGSGLKLELGTDKAKVEVTLAPRTGPVALAPAEDDIPGGGVEAAICTATVRSKGWGRSLQCPGQFSRWSGDPLDGVGTFRYLAVEAGVSLIALVAAGAAAAEHGQEQSAAWRLDAEGEVQAFAEALLSTQYDDAGHQTRAGLELWPQDEDRTIRAAATRGAGTRIGGTESEGVSAAFLRCSIEGEQGLGSYLLWRGPE